jgi:hypothetical protein
LESIDPAERELYARDVHSSVTLLALLLFVWGAVSLFTVPFRPFAVPNLTQVIVGGPALVYFLVSRNQPNTRVDLTFSAITITYTLLLLPWTAVVWCRLGRPLEAFTVPQVAMVTMALVIPRSFWLGAVLMALFAGESLFVLLYARHLGLEAALPYTEPWVSMIFAVQGIGLLLLRERRRQLAQRHLHVQAESEALRRIGPLFSNVRDELAARLHSLARELVRLSDGPPNLGRALDRLDGVRDRLDDLVEGQTLPVGKISERRLHDRDAHFGALVTAATIAVLSLLALMGASIVGLPLRIRWIAMAAVAAAIFAYLLASRHRPSERRALWAVLLLFAIYLPLMTVNQPTMLEHHRPYMPFVGHKLWMVLIGLVAASRVWLGVLLIAITAVDALVLYFMLHLGQHKDLIVASEPWVTLTFMIIGIVALVMREQRRLASVRLLRAEAETSALHRRALLFLALRDQLNTPLQTVVLCAAQLEHTRPTEELTQIRAEVERLVALSRELSTLDELIPTEAQRTSIDAEQALRRRA